MLKFSWLNRSAMSFLQPFLHCSTNHSGALSSDRRLCGFTQRLMRLLAALRSLAFGLETLLCFGQKSGMTKTCFYQRYIYISIDIIYIEPHLQLILMTTKILDMIDNQWPCGTRRLVQLGQWIRLWFHQLAVLLPVVGETPHCLLTRVEGPLKKSVRYPTWCP